MPLVAHCLRTAAARLGLALATLWLLGGCAGVMRVDNQVESFARWDAASGAPPAPQLYLFERLPSQRDGAAAQAQTELEALTVSALAAVGWQVAGSEDPLPRWRVQVQANGVRLPYAPWEEPRGGFWTGIGVSGGRGSLSVGTRLGWPMSPYPSLPYYQRQVSLLIRDASNGQVVYETRAAHDGRWNSTPQLWQAMIRAALADFPAPAPGTRQIDIDLPR